MIRYIVYTLLAATLLGAAATPASAQDDKYFGLGFIIGEPTGIDAKLFLNNTNALEFGAAWSLDNDEAFHLQADYLWHRYNLIKLNNQDELPLYFGIGARMVVRDDDDFPGDSGDDIFGIRFPVGLDYLFYNYPFDIFAAIVPILDVAPDSDFDLEGCIGARFWF